MLMFKDAVFNIALDLEVCSLFIASLFCLSVPLPRFDFGLVFALLLSQF